MTPYRLEAIGDALSDLVREISPDRLEELGFRPHRIAACVRRFGFVFGQD